MFAELLTHRFTVYYKIQGSDGIIFIKNLPRQRYAPNSKENIVNTSMLISQFQIDCGTVV
jgi:hypothetical protein